MYGDDAFENDELVIMVKPSIVMFSDKIADQEATKRKKEAANKLPDAVVIDKDGARNFAMPNSSGPSAAPANVTTSKATAASPTTASTAPESVTPPPELMVSEPTPAPMPAVPAGTDNNALVSRSLMQRGFSHAFDELLQPTTALPQSAADTPTGAGDKP
jgi:hypothetical protein